MTLFATMSFDDEDPALAVHMTGRAHDLEVHNPRELVRVLGTMEDALIAQAVKVARVKRIMEGKLTEHDEHRRAAR